MMHGTVSDRGVPIITLSIAGQEWAAIIDTGFNGDLELPEILRDELNPQYVGRVTSALAGAQTIEEDVYLADFPFDGNIIQARTTFVIGSEILIGTHLLREYRLEIDFVRRTVVLEKVMIG
ncbi:MAG: hypothetical protein OXI67_01355 [Candidatus Poribacteria bacterium]|nr:hypothetical protein [Candidatus Poribacteria bacterium]